MRHDASDRDRHLGVLIVLLLIGLIHPPIPNAVLSAGQFRIGVLSAGLFSAGVFSAGLFCVGIVSVGNYSLGVFSVGTFAAGFFVTRGCLEGREGRKA